MATQNGEPQEPDKFIGRTSRLVVGIAACWFVLLTLQGFLAARGIGPSWLRMDYELAGQFGDSFAPLNTVMAAIAAIAAIAAYRTQSIELRETRLRESANQQSADRRDFEETYFRLLGLLRETANETCARSPGSTKDYVGRDAFRMILRHVAIHATEDQNKEAWKEIYLRYQAQLGHYFRLVYQVLRYVDESKISDKKLYTRILRATMGNPEIVLLGLNGWLGGYPKTKRLVTKYSMLHNITASDAVNRRLNRGYPAEAFGDRDIISESKHGSQTLE